MQNYSGSEIEFKIQDLTPELEIEFKIQDLTPELLVISSVLRRYRLDPLARWSKPTVPVSLLPNLPSGVAISASLVLSLAAVPFLYDCSETPMKRGGRTSC